VCVQAYLAQHSDNSSVQGMELHPAVREAALPSSSVVDTQELACTAALYDAEESAQRGPGAGDAPAYDTLYNHGMVLQELAAREPPGSPLQLAHLAEVGGWPGAPWALNRWCALHRWMGRWPGVSCMCLLNLCTLCCSYVIKSTSYTTGTNTDSVRYTYVPEFLRGRRFACHARVLCTGPMHALCIVSACFRALCTPACQRLKNKELPSSGSNRP